MPNTAELLGSVLSQWSIDDKSETVYDRRDTWARNHGMSFWQSQLYATRLLSELDTTLNQLDAMGVATGPYRRASQWWAMAVFLPESQWTTDSSPEGQMDSENPNLDILEALGSLIDAHGLQPAIPSGTIESVLRAVDEASDLLQTDLEGLSREVRVYVQGLLAAARQALQSPGFFSPQAMRTAVSELYSGLELAEEESEEKGADTADLWRKIKDRVFWPVMASAGGQLAITAGAHLPKAIETLKPGS